MSNSTYSLERWRGKVALVTGASSGIGHAIAVFLGEIGLRVAVAGRDRERLGKVAEEIKSRGGEVLVLAGDQATYATNVAFFKEIRARWGGVDVLVNNAGTRGGNTMLDADWAEIESALDLNIKAALACMREAAQDMLGKTDAAVINISSMVGHRLLPGAPALYAATKHALRIMTDGMRSELAARQCFIKVALISPGLVDTPWHSQPHGLITTKGAYPYEPLQVEDVVSAVRYILSAPPHVQIGDIQLRSVQQPF